MHSYGGAFAWKHLLAFMHTAQCPIRSICYQSWNKRVNPYRYLGQGHRFCREEIVLVMIEKRNGGIIK